MLPITPGLCTGKPQTWKPSNLRHRPHNSAPKGHCDCQHSNGTHKGIILLIFSYFYYIWNCVLNRGIFVRSNASHTQGDVYTVILWNIFLKSILSISRRTLTYDWKKMH
ncbi:hypothetical protein TNCT_456841 [Trichonephila clavata]|uniref:Uncharacterized protein n=1 Tax=Trichonephila clavata TaxID=2740835 RepID=A0A8X6H6Z7_TRICU|nr:hypothetical protein TNCT_456841 [Trichonephila clavata]